MHRATTLDASLRNKKGATKLRPVHRTSDGENNVKFEKKDIMVKFNFIVVVSIAQPLLSERKVAEKENPTRQEPQRVFEPVCNFLLLVLGAI